MFKHSWAMNESWGKWYGGPEKVLDYFVSKSGSGYSTEPGRGH